MASKTMDGRSIRPGRAAMNASRGLHAHNVVVGVRLPRGQPVMPFGVMAAHENVFCTSVIASGAVLPGGGLRLIHGSGRFDSYRHHMRLPRRLSRPIRWDKDCSTGFVAEVPGGTGVL